MGMQGLKMMHDNKENQTAHLNQVMQQIHVHNSKVRASAKNSESTAASSNTRRSHKDLLKSLSQMSA